MANAASSASSPGAGASSSSSSPQAGGGGDAHTPRQRQGRPVRAGSDPLLIVCGCFSVVTAATALLCVAVNVVSAVQSFSAGSDIFGGICRCYAVVFSLFVAVLETEWGFIIRFWKIFEYWPARGMLQIFVAVMTKAYPSIERNDLILLQEIASYMLLACGAVYVISGILCIGVLKRSRQQKATSREQAAKDLQAAIQAIDFDGLVPGSVAWQAFAITASSSFLISSVCMVFQELEKRREELEALLLAERSVLV